jgi:hypothetical protein
VQALVDAAVVVVAVVVPALDLELAKKSVQGGPREGVWAAARVGRFAGDAAVPA